MNNISNDERRDFFRIEDEVYLELETISAEEYSSAEEVLANLHNDSFSLSADFATLNNNLHPVLNNIKQIHPDIAQYLELLNNKIDSLGEFLLHKSSAYDENKRIKANVSASGIMFESESIFKQGDLIRLELVLFPEKIGVLIFGKTVKITKSTNEKQNISIEFEHIRTEDRELMIKHNLNKQMTDLREKNQND
jgi:PilZ domain